MKRILITGGSRGIGLAVCGKLLREGHHVITCAREPTAEIIGLQKKFGQRIEFYPLDLAISGAASRLAREARLLEEGLDGFVANAATGLAGLLLLTPPAKLRQCIDLNLCATIQLTREVIKAMRSAGGSIVFISSIAALRGFSGLSVYSATKGALLAFSRSIAREYGSLGIRSNSVLPGFLETEMSRSIQPARRQRIRRRTALGRLGRPEDLCETVWFLLSDASRFLTGAEVAVDGGYLA